MAMDFQAISIYYMDNQLLKDHRPFDIYLLHLAIALHICYANKVLCYLLDEYLDIKQGLLQRSLIILL